MSAPSSNRIRPERASATIAPRYGLREMPAGRLAGALAGALGGVLVGGAEAGFLVVDFWVEDFDDFEDGGALVAVAAADGGVKGGSRERSEPREEMRSALNVFRKLPIEWEMANKNNTCGLVVAVRDPSICRPIAEALYAAGLVTQRLVTQISNAEEIITRADAEGGVPIIVAHSSRIDGVKLVCELLACDTLPARPYVLVAPDDVLASLAAEQLEAAVPHSVERVQVVSMTDLIGQSTRDLLKLHFSRACVSYLGRTPRIARAAPAPITEMPIGERNIYDIDRRVMQRGMFKVAALRVPRF